MMRENIEKIRDKIHKACAKVNRNPDSITIVGACKKMTPEKVEEAYNYGIKIMGENIVQDAMIKYEALKHTDIEWHMIGHLQTNKIRKALEIFSTVQSVDSFHLAEQINKRMEHPACPAVAVAMAVTKKKLPVLIEVNTSGEISKYGLAPEQVISVLRQISTLPNIKIQGLMTIGPLDKDPRPAFRLLRELRDKIELENIPKVSMKWLSMGMSDDYEIAIEEGSNMLRLGRVIFGERL